MRNHAGTADEVRKDDLVEQMRTEVVASFQNVLNELGTSEHKIPVLELPSNTDEIKKTMDEKVFDAPIRERGIQLVGFAVESVTLDDESMKKIDNYELSSNSFMQQGTLVGAYANAVQDAANNANGAANGFYGVGMMNMASGGMMGGTTQAAFNTQGTTAQGTVDPFEKKEKVPVETSVVDGVPCPKCGTMITGKFCPECGEPKPEKQTEAPKEETPVEEVAEKKCPQCGAVVTGKFCTECGTEVE
jgi:membrane protease subunit (stomatin/prohibitin family)